MTASELLLEDFDAEMASTRRTLERIPADKADYKPHDKSFTFSKLAMHVATLPHFGKYILTSNGMDMANNDMPQPDRTFSTTEAMLATFDAGAADARKALAAASDNDLAANWKFSFGDHVIANFSRSRSYRMFFFNHLIHHRAQLGIYLRLNDVPVPGVYGPSADEQFNPGK